MADTSPDASTLDPAQIETTKEHLRLLAIFHYVLAGLMGLFGLFMLTFMAFPFLFVGTAMFSAAANGEFAPETAPKIEPAVPEDHDASSHRVERDDIQDSDAEPAGTVDTGNEPVNDVPSALFGTLFGMGFGFFFFAIIGIQLLFLIVVPILTLIAGLNLNRYRNRTFCFVVACVLCLLQPIGTILGIFTIIVLNRPEAKWLFAQSTPQPAAPRLPGSGTADGTPA